MFPLFVLVALLASTPAFSQSPGPRLPPQPPLKIGFSSQPLLTSPHPDGERLLTDVLPEALDGRLAFAYRLARTQGHPEGEKHWLLGDSVREEGIHVGIVASRRIDEPFAAGLRARGCTVDRLPDGQLASVGPVVEAWCSWSGLWASAQLESVSRIAPTFDYELHRPIAPPVQQTLTDVEAPQLIESLYPATGGEGIIVADMDSGVDVFHPFLFNADGGYYAWIDFDGDGALTPGVDGVDFDGDGILGEGELLRVLKSLVVDHYSGDYWNDDPEFRAGYDWLYQDENLNGARDFGPQFGDVRPTFGEAMYLVDDVNRNGQLDTGEKLVRLHSSKIRAVRDAAGRIFRRDIDLSQADFAGEEGHGTMVLGSLAGGVPPLTRYSGVAPAAELVLASTRSMNLVSSLAFAIGEGASIVLWEMATWYGDFLDGSSALERACDAAMDDGVLQIGAAGNLGGSQKHAVQTISASQTRDFRLVIPAGKASWVYGDLVWRGASAGQTQTLFLNGSSVELSGNEGSAELGSAIVQWARYASPRGSQMILFYFAAPQGQFLTGQTATLRFQNGAAEATVHGYVTDSFTSWEKGVYWPLEDGATDYGTYGTPGTSDRTLSIATYFASSAKGGRSIGELASYSGKGPRIDGADSVDFAAPEDLFTAWEDRTYFGGMRMGAGTSNASPVAVGVFALLLAQDPSLTPGQLIERVKTHSGRDALVGQVPNHDWGWGRVRAFRAQHGTTPPLHEAPVAVASATSTTKELYLNAEASSDPEGSALRYRWDLDYDGAWDVDVTESAEARAPRPPEGATQMKLEVSDAEGKSAQVLLAVPAPTQVRPVRIEKIPRALGGPPQGCSSTPGLLVWLAPAGMSLLLRRRQRLS